MQRLHLAGLLALFCTTLYVVEGQRSSNDCDPPCDRGTCLRFFIFSGCLCEEGYGGKNCSTDQMAPFLVCPNTLYRSTDRGTNRTSVSFGPIRMSDNSGSEPDLYKSPASGSTFFYGENEVEMKAVDNSGNEATCTFTIHVQDKEPPMITCPPDMTYFLSNGEMHKVVEFAAETVRDNVDQDITVTSSPSSGSEFFLGTNVVQMSAVDKSQNVGICNFTVTVRDMLTCEDGSNLGSDDECNYIWDCSDGRDEYHCAPEVVDEMESFLHPSDEDGTFKFQVEDGLGIHITFYSNNSRGEIAVGEGSEPGKYVLFTQSYLYDDLDIFLPSNIAWVMFKTNDRNRDGLVEILVESTQVTRPISIDDEAYILTMNESSYRSVYVWKVNAPEGKWIRGSFGEAFYRYSYRSNLLIKGNDGQLIDIFTVFQRSEEFLLPVDVIWMRFRGNLEYPINLFAQEPIATKLPVGGKHVVSYRRTLRSPCSMDSFVIELSEPFQYVVRLRNVSTSEGNGKIIMFEQEQTDLLPIGVVTYSKTSPYLQPSMVAHLTKSKVVLLSFPSLACRYQYQNWDNMVVELEFKPEDLSVQLEDGDVFPMSSAQECYSESLAINRRVFTSDNEIFVEAKLPLQPCSIFYSGSLQDSPFLMTEYQETSFQSSLIGVTTQDLGILNVDLMSSPFALGCPYHYNVHPTVPNDGYMVCSDGKRVVSQEQVCNTIVDCPGERDEIGCVPREVVTSDPVSLVATPRTTLGKVYTFQKTNSSQRFLVDARLLTLSSSSDQDREVLAAGSGRYLGDNSTAVIVLNCSDLIDEGTLLVFEDDVIWIKVLTSMKRFPFFGTLSVGSIDDYVDCGNNIAITNDRRCDGLHHCSMGTDEMNCAPLTVGESISLALPSRSQDVNVLIWTFTKEERGVFLLHLKQRYNYRYIAVGTGSDPSDNSTIIEQWSRFDGVDVNVFVPENAIWIKMEPQGSVPNTSPGSVFVSTVTEFNVTQGATREFSSPRYPEENTEAWVGLWVYRFPSGMGGLIRCNDISLRSGTVMIGVDADFQSDRSIVSLINHYRYNSAEIQIPSDTIWISSIFESTIDQYHRRGSRFHCSVSAVPASITLLANDPVEIEYQAENDKFLWTGWVIETPDSFKTLFSFNGGDFDTADIGVGIDFEENVTAEYFFPSNDRKKDVATNGSAWTFLSSQRCYRYSLCSWSYTVTAVNPQGVMTCDGYVFTEDDVCNNRTACIDGTDENECVTARLRGNDSLTLYPPFRDVVDLIWSVVVETGFQPLVRLRNIAVRYGDQIQIGSGIWQAGKSPFAFFDRSNSTFNVLIPSDSVWIRYQGYERPYYGYGRRAFEMEITAVEVEDFFACTESVVVVNSTLVCDGEPNCPYGDDEIGCEIFEGEFVTLMTTGYPSNRPADIMQNWEYHTTEDNIAMVVHFRGLFLSNSERFCVGIGELSPENSSVDYRPAQDCYLTSHDPVEDLYLESNMMWINIDSEYYRRGGRMWAELRVVKTNDDFIRCNDGRHIAAVDQLCDNLWTCEDGEDEVECDAVSLEGGDLFSLEFSDPYSFPRDTKRTWTFRTPQQDSAIAITVTTYGYRYADITVGEGTDFIDRDSVVKFFGFGNRYEDIFILGTEAWLTSSGSLREVVVNVTVVSRSELYTCEGSERIIVRDKLCDNTWDCKSGSDESNCEPVFIDISDNYVLSLSKPVEYSVSTQSWIFEIPDGKEASIELRTVNLNRAQISVGSGSDPSNVNTRLIATIDDTDKMQWMVAAKHVWVKTVVDSSYSTLSGTVEVKSIPPPPGTCEGDAFQCTLTRECIETSSTCDGRFDCEDRSDEISCDCASPSEVRCGTGECFSRSSLCRGYSPSSGAACLDEMAICDFECPAWEGSTVISNRFVCDGFLDCVDGSDEEIENCDCKPPAYSCGDKCITQNQVCDGINDCRNGTDEIDCECSSFEVPCEESDCIAYWDGCMDETCMNVDECRACPPKYFQCQDFTCLPVSSVCDFVSDCSNGEDEEGCPDIPTVRLVGGIRGNEGRVEIFHDGVWGTVCDDLWDDRDASVVCRQLGFGDSGDALQYAHFGSGVGPIWLDNVGCTGSENRLEDCRSRGWGIHDCGHAEDAGVRCDYDVPTVRLVGGNTTYEGRVEVFYEGEWGTVCDDDWDENDATIICRQLGLGISGEAFRTATFGSGIGPIWLDNVACRGYERSIESCRSNDWGDHNCGHYEDAGVRCNDGIGTLPPAVPFTTGSDGQCYPNPCRNGGTCIDLPPGLPSLPIPLFICLCPPGILGLNCESFLSTPPPAIPFTTTLNGLCSPDPCRNGGSCLDLGNSYICLCQPQNYGINCESTLETETSAPLLTSLGFDYGFEYTTSNPYEANCDQDPCRNRGICIELSVSFLCLCQIDFYGATCEFSYYEEDEYMTTISYEGDFMTTELPFSLDVAVGEDSPVTLTSPGYPESLPKFKEGTWVISAPFGYGIQVEVVDVDVGYGSSFQLGTGSTVGRNFISEFSIRFSHGNPSSLLLRSSDIWFTFTSESYRNHRGFVFILTAIEGIGIQNTYYLMENDTTNIESPNYPVNYPVKVDEIWNFGAAESLGFVITFSDFSLEENWDYVTIGYGNEPSLNAITAKWTGYSIPESVSINSNSLWMRFTSDLSNTSRGFRAQVKAIAAELIPSDIRLAGGNSENEGRVEIFYNGVWGTVCGDSWDSNDAQVVCRELGFGGYGDALLYSRYGQGVGPIWLDNVQCSGNELRLEDCRSNGWGIHNCVHLQDASVRCQGPPYASTDIPHYGFTDAPSRGNTISLQSNSPRTIYYYGSYGYGYYSSEEVWNLVAPDNHSIQISFLSFDLYAGELETLIVLPSDESVLIARYSGLSSPEAVEISSSNVVLSYIPSYYPYGYHPYYYRSIPYHPYGDDSFWLTVTAVPDSIEECASDAIPVSFRCNGKSECKGNIDEVDCDINTADDNTGDLIQSSSFVRIGHHGLATCGGTVINSRWVLTAAECLTQQSTTSYEVLVDVDDFPKNYSTDDTYSVVAEIEVNTANGAESGIALLKLDRPLEGFGTYVFPLSLPENGSVVNPGTYVNVVGWSRAGNEEDAAAFITITREPVVSDEFCMTRQNPLSLMGGGFCTGYIQSYGADCFNIFGGPVVYEEDDGCREIIGVVMRQPPPWQCGQLFAPKMHPLISSHVDFIKDIMRYV